LTNRGARRRVTSRVSAEIEPLHYYGTLLAWQSASRKGESLAAWWLAREQTAKCRLVGPARAEPCRVGPDPFRKADSSCSSRAESSLRPSVSTAPKNLSRMVLSVPGGENSGNQRRMASIRDEAGRYPVMQTCSKQLISVGLKERESRPLVRFSDAELPSCEIHTRQGWHTLCLLLNQQCSRLRMVARK